MHKHSTCPLTACVPIWAHMRSETLFNTNRESTTILFTFVFVVVAAGAFFYAYPQLFEHRTLFVGFL